MAVTLLGEFEIRRKISLIADSSWVSRTTSVSWPEAEELLWRTAFRVFALRLRALGSLLLALERRRIAHPKGLGLRRFSKSITAGICDRRNGYRSNCAAKRTAHVRFGSKADIGARPRDVRFTPQSRH